MPTYGQPLAGFCAATAVFLCGLAGFPVASELLPPATGGLVLTSESGASETTLLPGAEVRLLGAGFADEAAVTISLYSDPIGLGTTTADAEGEIDATVTLPDTLVGEHTISALGNAPDGSAHSLQATVSLERTAPAAAGTLAETGLRSAAIAATGLGMVVLGFALIRSTVYRRKFLPVS